MNKIYTVKNRSSNTVIYRIPEDRIRRLFTPGEIKQISHEELEKLSYQPGGSELIQKYLQINDTDAANQFNGGVPVEPEYNFSETDVRDLLTTGSLDRLLDALDYAPAGVIDLIKTTAVNLPLGDIPKLNAIKAKTGFDAATAIRHVEEEKAAAAEELKSNVEGNVFDNGGKRRVAVDSNTSTSGRRAPVDNKYKIVSVEE